MAGLRGSSATLGSVLHLALIFLLLGYALLFGVVYRLLKSLHHVFLESFFFKDQTILVPDKVWCLHIKSVSFHATLKETKNVAIVRVSCE